MPSSNGQLEEIAKAIFIVNRHAKAALEPQHLYKIKKLAVEKLLQQKRAEKIGLHFSNNPKFSNQHSTLLVKIGNYYFHIPPSKQDFKEVKHLGTLNHHFRNPKTRMSLSKAKKILYNFIDLDPPKKTNQTYRHSSYFTPSSLGKFNWNTKRNSNKHY